MFYFFPGNLVNSRLSRPRPFRADITSWMGLANVESVCDFPAELARLGGLMRTVGELNATRNTMSIDIAEASMQVKDLVVQAEDARMLGRFRDVRRGLDDLVDVNNQLIGESSPRPLSHSLLDFARFRVRASSRPLVLCSASPHVQRSTASARQTTRRCSTPCVP